MPIQPNPFRQPALDPDLADQMALGEHGQGDDVREKMRTVMPWVISFAGHLGVLVLAASLALAIKVVLPPSTPPPIPTIDPDDAPRDGRPEKLPGQFTNEYGGGAQQGPDVPMPTQPHVAAPQMPANSGSEIGRVATKINIKTFESLPDLTQVKTGGRHGIFELDGSGLGDGQGGERGASQPAKKIVFLVDASGSLVDTLPFVVNELGRILDSKISADKSFNLIFFSGNGMNHDMGSIRGVATLFPSGLQPATPSNRKRAADWIRQVKAGGSSDALLAIKQALAMDPDQIHLLSDNITGNGQWEVHQDHFMAEVKRAYAQSVARRNGRRVSFKTYQFVYQDALVQLGKQPTLQRMVADTGGNVERDYAFVSARQLGLR